MRAIAAVLLMAAMPVVAADSDLRTQTKEAIELCHARARIYYLERSDQAKANAQACAADDAMAPAMQAYASAAKSAALADYVAAWRAAMKNSPASGMNVQAQRETRDRLTELWERYAIEANR